MRIQNRDDAVICVNKGRLYLWFRSDGSATNDESYVWNLNYKTDTDTVESHDTKANIGRALTAYNDDNQLLVGSSHMGRVYWQELSSNDYSDVGEPYELILQTHYMPFVSPAITKEVRYWKARFEAESGDYRISCEYAYDLRDNWTVYQDLAVQGMGEVYGGGATYGGGAVYGATATLQGDLYVPGEYKRIALRYTHDATRQPHTFLGQTLVVQTRRMR